MQFIQKVLFVLLLIVVICQNRHHRSYRFNKLKLRLKNKLRRQDKSDKKFTVYDDKCALGNEGTTVQPSCATDECKGKIIQILYANYGLPNGSCPRFSDTEWCTHEVSKTVNDLCDGKETCDVDVSNNSMGRDPCPGHGKRLYITYQCECSVQQKKIGVNVFQR